MGTINIMVPVGALGAGIRAEHVAAGLTAGAHVIALDAGSTDSGPAYLATGRCKYSRDAIKADLAILMRAQAQAGIPLLIGSCGTSGCDAAVDWTRDIALEIAQEEKLAPRIAVLYSEQQADVLVARAERGGIAPLAPMIDVDPSAFRRCDHIVALMGPEPYIAALDAGADIVLGGRTSDTAVLAAAALRGGAGRGPSWHAGKTAECGGLCTVNPRGGGVMLRIDTDSFVVEPLAADNRCTAYTVSAHMLYENADPVHLTEPGGITDVGDARYAEMDERSVRVTGSRFHARPYTMKLEGAAADSFQTIMLIGVRDPKVLREIDRFVEQMQQTLEDRVKETIGDAAGRYDISLRPYGWNAMTGVLNPPGTAAPVEMGLLFVATAATQELATRIAKTCNPIFFHMPLQRDAELPSYGFPFSPAEIERGAVYEFLLNHVVSVNDPMELVRLEMLPELEVIDA